MDKKVEAYFNRIEAGAKESGIHLKEMEEIIRILDIFLEIGLLNKSEQEQWQKKLTGKLFQGIETLQLSPRSYHALYRAGVTNYGQLREHILNKNILNIRNIGAESASEVLGMAIQKGIIKEEEIECTDKNKAWKKVLVNLKQILSVKVTNGLEIDYIAVPELSGEINGD